MSNDTPASSGILQEMTIDDVRALDPEVVVLGIGSTEPHGPHLPYGTDTFRVEEIGRRAVPAANDQGASALLYPSLPIGNNVNFKAWPHACRIGVRTLMDVVLDIIEALEEDGIQKIVLLNGHGGNTDTLEAALREHAGRHGSGGGAFVALVSAANVARSETTDVIDHPSPHAGEAETCQILHLRPDLVREDKFENFPSMESTLEQLEENTVTYVPRWDAYLPQSAGGETRESTPEKGEAIIEATADWLADFLLALNEADVHELFPYPEHEN